MNETFLIRDVLSDESHEGHSAVKDMMEKLASGEISMCGCLGPMYGEPYCPCQMKQKGLEAEMENNPLRIAEEAASAKSWKGFVDGGGFSKYERDL